MARIGFYKQADQDLQAMELLAGGARHTTMEARRTQQSAAHRVPTARPQDASIL